MAKSTGEEIREKGVEVLRLITEIEKLAQGYLRALALGEAEPYRSWKVETDGKGGLAVTDWLGHRFIATMYDADGSASYEIEHFNIYSVRELAEQVDKWNVQNYHRFGEVK